MSQILVLTLVMAGAVYCAADFQFNKVDFLVGLEKGLETSGIDQGRVKIANVLRPRNTVVVNCSGELKGQVTGDVSWELPSGFFTTLETDIFGPADLWDGEINLDTEFTSWKVDGLLACLKKKFLLPVSLTQRTLGRVVALQFGH
ncbi:hypothetical protein R1sor_022457 [Riccia sorocarpa]|uniref:Uncharacterized protein n=1 Tax=Riccia sorocarpa TaxID=122646 RepID=A0ABD3GLN1_9MARC